jgi:sarcosine oxidase subunit gamma
MPEPAQMRAAPNEGAAVQIGLVMGLTFMRLKSWLPESTTSDKPIVLPGGELSSKVGAILSGSMRVLCLGPGEWLIVSHEHHAASIRKDIELYLPRSGLSLVDLSDGLATLEVQGAPTRDLLAKGCGLDLHPLSFPPGRCARTRFAQVPVVMECRNEPSRFELTVARSYLRYLHAWLADAAAEFGDHVT